MIVVSPLGGDAMSVFAVKDPRVVRGSTRTHLPVLVFSQSL